MDEAGIYVTSDADVGTDEETEAPTVKRARSDAKKWKFVKKFYSADEAVALVNDEQCWSVRDKYGTREGSKVVYRCKAVRRRGKQCPASVYLLYHATTECVSLYRKEAEHDHTDNRPTRGLPSEIRPFVEEKVEDGISAPTMISRALVRHSMPVPQISQLRNYVQHYTRTRYGPANMNIGEFEHWCADHSEYDPSDPDAPYVVNHLSDVDKAGKAIIRAYISTPRLLAIAASSFIVHADATFKLDSTKRPTIIVGTSDRDRKFHPAGFVISNGETIADYEFAFRSMADGILQHTGSPYEPRFLVADAAPAITCAFTNVFTGEYRRIVCWAHVIRKIDNRLKSSVDEGTRKSITADISQLQLCHSEQIFNVALELFFRKWRALGEQNIDEFLQYFYKQWLRGWLKGWFEGYAPLVPSTNNCLESTNSRIKCDCTFHIRMPIARLLNVSVKRIVSYWSVERNPLVPEFKQFSMEPTKGTALWTRAYQWSQLRRTSPAHVRTSLDGLTKWYLIPSAELKPGFLLRKVDDYCTSFGTLTWPSFNNYVDISNSIWCVTVINDQWESATCTCPKYQKEYTCKHVVGLAIRKGYYQPPQYATVIPISQLRKKGRPRRAAAALIVD